MSALPKPFKKLHSDLIEKLEYLEMTVPTEFQIKSIPVIKSGANVYCTAPAGSGKTTTLILTTLQKLKCEAEGTAPRAIIVVENKEKADELHDAFLAYIKYNSLRVYVAHEKTHVDLQKSEIFEGVDILISTPESINKLFLLNGITTASLKLFCIDDAEFLVTRQSYATILSITQSISKCQFVLYMEKMPPKLRELEDYFMEFAKIVKA